MHTIKSEDALVHRPKGENTYFVFQTHLAVNDTRSFEIHNQEVDLGGSSRIGNIEKA